MAEYSLTEEPFVIRTIDQVWIPDEPLNADRQKYDAWRAAGNAPDPFVLNPAIAAIRTRKASFDVDATRADLLTRVQVATPAQINAYVDANAANLAEARTLLKKILLVIAKV